MKRRSAWLSFAACALTAAAPCRPGRAAQAPTGATPEVQIVKCGDGLTGIFDRAAGRLYLCDATLQNCVAIKEVSELSEALSTLTPSPAESKKT